MMGLEWWEVADALVWKDFCIRFDNAMILLQIGGTVLNIMSCKSVAKYYQDGRSY